jgi:3-hydroxyisobutyrate dehydrogenase-like beta-hydroxyacid dehydrogenase
MDVGMIGFGAMGSAMAGHIIKKRGHKVHAFDVDPARLQEARHLGATPVASPAALGPLARLIIVMVATDEQAREVVRPTSKRVRWCARPAPRPSPARSSRSPRPSTRGP